MKCIGLILLILAGECPVAMASKQSASTSQRNIRVTYLQSTVSLDDASQNGSGKLLTSWFTSKGSRQEMADGDIAIILHKERVFIFLHPETKTARRSAVAGMKDTPEMKRTVARMQRTFGQMSQTRRHEQFLGRTCDVIESEAIIAGNTVRFVIWNAEIAGQTVTLRSLSKTFRRGGLVGVWLQEAVGIEPITSVPPDLLAIPRDYSIVEIDAAAFKQMLPEVPPICWTVGAGF